MPIGPSPTVPPSPKSPRAILTPSNGSYITKDALDVYLLVISHNAPTRAQTSLIAAQIIYGMPFNDLLFEAHGVHRKHFDPNSGQMSRLLSIKTGGCTEDCGTAVNQPSTRPA